MKTKFAASSSVQEDEPGKPREVMMQGYWEKTLADYLTEQYGLPEMCLEVIRPKKGEGEKAAKKATNICRR